MIYRDLVPPNLADLGLKRSGPADSADLQTIWRSPYPVIRPYLSLCQSTGLTPFGGGTMEQQGRRDVPGYITSGYRDVVLEGNFTSPHLFAFAIDIAVGNVREQIRVGAAALRLFPRLGLYPESGFIHVDAAPENWIREFNKAHFWCRVNGRYHSFEDRDALFDFARAA